MFFSMIDFISTKNMPYLLYIYKYTFFFIETRIYYEYSFINHLLYNLFSVYRFPIVVVVVVGVFFFVLGKIKIYYIYFPY